MDSHQDENLKSDRGCDPVESIQGFQQADKIAVVHGDASVKHLLGGGRPIYWHFPTQFQHKVDKDFLKREDRVPGVAYVRDTDSEDSDGHEEGEEDEFDMYDYELDEKYRGSRWAVAGSTLSDRFRAEQEEIMKLYPSLVNPVVIPEPVPDAGASGLALTKSEIEMIRKRRRASLDHDDTNLFVSDTAKSDAKKVQLQNVEEEDETAGTSAAASTKRVVCPNVVYDPDAALYEFYERLRKRGVIKSPQKNKHVVGCEYYNNKVGIGKMTDVTLGTATGLSETGVVTDKVTILETPSLEPLAQLSIPATPKGSTAQLSISATPNGSTDQLSKVKEEPSCSCMGRGDNQANDEKDVNRCNNDLEGTPGLTDTILEWFLDCVSAFEGVEYFGLPDKKNDASCE